MVLRPGVYRQAADEILHFHNENPIAEIQVEHAIFTLEIQKTDRDNSSVVCAVAHVKMSMPSEAILLESQQCDTYRNNVMKMVNVEQSWSIDEKHVLCHEA